ncbi:Ubiquitin- modifier 1 [Trebouxia sp. C0010 RCD-2024]
MVRVDIQFSGGLEILFGNQSTIVVDVSPPKQQTELDIAHLLVWLRDNLLTERPELFMQGNTVRPGILVLVNDVDWELSGMLETIIEDDDTVVFISTLHGG